MHLAYVTSYNVLNHSDWPESLVGLRGAGYHLAQHLEKQSVQLDYIGPLKQEYRFLNRFKRKFYRKFLKKVYACWADPAVIRDYAKQVSRKLSSSTANIVLCPENAQTIAYLECKQPIVLWTDAPQTVLIDFYSIFSNFCNESKRHVYALEKAALDRSKLVIFLSDWAAENAIKIYGIQPSKVRVVPWGANIECNRTYEDIHNIVESKDTRYCRLLFIGVDWLRKGGDTAVEVAKELNEIGLKTELIVVGSEPPISETFPNYVKFLGFINKYTTEGIKQINELFCTSHFLIVPSRAETYGHVFCEANSFGLPSLATNVGGIPTIIKDGVNGKTFSVNSRVEEYSTYIADLMSNYSEYKRLACSSFHEYQSRLNWLVAAKTAKQLIMDLV
ncbi:MULTISPECIES: glycosyltransferase family 4 protein [Fischerella]|uniref:Group 1 glycosyl transferase n=1 Tax=Fischerella muscicola CCMEE 5323 TaxID=2019572 RepID=A0A2N6K9C8_FISMU|nr:MULTISPECIES: glycosyltransferase family 4 protein [Fischerella]MBD2434058.1 glycosyltransferase family 4 protein [Fischerella sp. FACHB-380]PLZ94617.1 group 1 glycosyl transferase [Fischerella muscicola CCMEE 5323]